MEDKNLISKLSLLKSVTPRENWTLYTRNQILSLTKFELSSVKDRGVGRGFFGEKVGHAMLLLRYLERPAFVLASLVLVVASSTAYKVSRNSLPGDALFPVKVAIERAAISIGASDSDSNSIEGMQVAQLRLEDLKKAVDGNKAKNVASAKAEFAKSVAVVSRGFQELVENNPARALQASREIIELQNAQMELEHVLGVQIGKNERLAIETATQTLVEGELNDLAERTLDAVQKELLKEAIAAYEAKKFDAALEKIWEITN
ncbi:MAG: hypothetical protein HY482_02000 [Candidatus Wildermuthbacteria bacterium]|nr:hypothetical protein [Candidatus Wildermuthbacteria bacterium]